MSKQKGEESFWDAMQKSAEPARSSPSWMKAGINLSENNFTTFRGAAPSVGGQGVRDSEGNTTKK